MCFTKRLDLLHEQPAGALWHYTNYIDNEAFIDVRLRHGIATPPTEDRATAKGDLHKKIRQDRSSGSRDMLMDGHTYRRVDHNTPHPYRPE